MNIVLLGAPGCGKGTHARKIKEKYGFIHLSTGELFRKEIANKTSIGFHAKEILDRGELCQDKMTLDLLSEYIASIDKVSGIILDGVPRTIDQAKMLDGTGYHSPIKITLVINLQVEEDIIIQRLLKRATLEGRSDDTFEIIQNRIRTYESHTKPLIHYYEKQNKLIQINGSRDIEEVFNHICNIIDQYLASSK